MDQSMEGCPRTRPKVSSTARAAGSNRCGTDACVLTPDRLPRSRVRLVFCGFRGRSYIKTLDDIDTRPKSRALKRCAILPQGDVKGNLNDPYKAQAILRDEKVEDPRRRIGARAAASQACFAGF